MNRKEYTLDRRRILSELKNKINGSRYYKFLFIYHKNELVYALLFSLKSKGLYFGYRAFKRNVEKIFLRKATVSYWAEKLIFEFGKQQGATFFSRGKDSHPFLGRKRLGLPLYKLKTGMKPRIPLSNTIFETTSLGESEILKKNSPFLFFSEENEAGFYSVCNLYYPEGSVEDSFLNEFSKVAAWSGLRLNIVKY